jgi:hypothetical protein
MKYTLEHCHALFGKGVGAVLSVLPPTCL